MCFLPAQNIAMPPFIAEMRFAARKSPRNMQISPLPFFPFLFVPCHACQPERNENPTPNARAKYATARNKVRPYIISWVHWDADEGWRPIVLRQPPVVYCQAHAAYPAARPG